MAQTLEAVQQATLNQIPEFALSEAERVSLADAKARMEVLGDAPDEDYFALVNRAAEGIEQGYQDAYINAGVEEDAAAIAAIAQRKQFLGESVSPDEATAIANAEATVQEKRRAYGRTINSLKEQYSGEVGSVGSADLMESAAKLRAGQSVYGNEPTEGQIRLLKAADIQRRNGIAKQLQQDYETAGAPSPLAQAAGDIKAQDYIFGSELSEAQTQRVEQADKYLIGVQGQLKRTQQQRFMANQVKLSYQEGRTRQSLEDAGVEPMVAQKAAKIEVSAGRQPVSEEDSAFLNELYASVGLTPNAEVMAGHVEHFMDVAETAGINVPVGGTEVAQGENYTISRTADVTVLENRHTEGMLVSQDGAVLTTDGLDQTDQQRLARLGQISVADIQSAVQPGQTPQRSSQDMELA